MVWIENQIRIFIALRLPPELCQKLMAFAEQFKPLSRDIRWVAEENLHLTLHFLGDVDSSLVPKIMTACQLTAREVPPFKLDFIGSGVFPNFRQPRVLWVGVKDEKKVLEKLLPLLSGQLAVIGLKLEEEQHSPHLTLGRIKFLKQTNDLKQLVEKTKTYLVGSLFVQKITVYKSVLSSKGPEYTIMGETYLKGD